MAEVTLSIGGRPHRVACRDGEESRVRALGQMLDDRWTNAAKVAGGSAERAFLFVALMLADNLDEAERRPLPVGAGVSEESLNRIADDLESLASALEQTPSSS